MVQVSSVWCQKSPVSIILLQSLLASTMGTTLSGSFMQLGSQAFQAITEKILFIYISFSLNTVQPAFFLWVIFLLNSVASPKWHILCRTGLSFLASERGLRDLEGCICHLKLCLCWSLHPIMHSSSNTCGWKKGLHHVTTISETARDRYSAVGPVLHKLLHLLAVSALLLLLLFFPEISPFWLLYLCLEL